MGRLTAGEISWLFFLEEMELKLLFWTSVCLHFFCCSDLLLAPHSLGLAADWKQRSSSCSPSEPSVRLNNVSGTWEHLSYYLCCFYMRLKRFSANLYWESGLLRLIFLLFLLCYSCYSESWDFIEQSGFDAKHFFQSRRNFVFTRQQPI